MDLECLMGPVPNMDISGIGVRISFYAQAVLLALLSARSGSSIETTNALSTLIITNLAYTVTTLLLGFKRNPELTLYDALVVLYLLGLSWIAIFFSLPQYNRFKYADVVIKAMAVLQSYLIFACGLAVLCTAHTFGANAACNHVIQVVIFRPFPLLDMGRKVLLALLSAVIAGYTGLLWNDYRIAGSFRPGAASDETGDKPNKTMSAIPMTQPHLLHVPETQRHNLPPLNMTRTVHNPPSVGVDGRVVVTISFILVLSTFAVVNTELLRKHNHPQPVDHSWGFSQILPMFLTFLPLTNTLKSFKTYGLGPKPLRNKRSRSRQRKKARNV